MCCDYQQKIAAFSKGGEKVKELLVLHSGKDYHNKGTAYTYSVLDLQNFRYICAQQRQEI